MNKIFYYTANFLSWIFHPLLAASIACVIVFNSGHYIGLIENHVKTSIFLIFFIMTFLIPVLFIPVFYYFNMITKMEMDTRKDRVFSLFIIGIMYVISFVFMSRAHFPDILTKIILSSAVSVFICLLTSLFYKVSLHSCGTGGLTGFVLYLAIFLGLNVELFLILIVMISGIVASSRLFLGKHNQSQVYFGWLLGFVIVSFVFYFF